MNTDPIGPIGVIGVLVLLLVGFGLCIAATVKAVRRWRR